jgi:hypothetical protein
MEQDVAIPLITIGTAIVGWLLYLTQKIHSNEKAIAENNINDQRVNGELQRIYNMLEKFEIKVDSSIDKLDKKMEVGLNKLEYKIERLIKRRHENDED